MSVKTIPGLRVALDLLDRFSQERDPSEVLQEYRALLTAEIEDLKPTVRELQDWISKQLYQHYQDQANIDWVNKALEDFNLTVTVEKVAFSTILTFPLRSKEVQITLAPGHAPRGRLGNNWLRIDHITAR